MGQVNPNTIGPIESWLSGAHSIDDVKNLFADSTAFQSLLDDITALKPTDKERIQELLSMTPPWVSPMIIFQVFQNPDLTMGLISRIGVTEAALQESLAAGIGGLETTLILSALVTWAKNQDVIAEQMLAADKKQNIIEEALKKYIQDPTKGPGNIIATLQTLRSSPLLITSLSSVSPQVLQQAYAVVEHQIIIAFLDAMIESEATRRDQLQATTKKETAKSQDQKSDIIHDQVTKESINKSELQHKLLNSDPKRPIADIIKDTVLSEAQKAQDISQNIAIGILKEIKEQDLTMSPVIASLLPLLLTLQYPLKNGSEILPIDVFQNSFGNVTSYMPPEVAASLNIIGSGAQVLACYWCIPAAISLATLNRKSVAEEKIPESAVKAYALTLASLVNNPSFLQLVDHVILRSVVDPKSMNDEKLAMWRSMLIMSLLTNALSALYKSSMGHLTKEEILSMLTGKMAPSPGIQQALVTMIRQEMKNIPEKDQKKVFEHLVAHLDQNPNLESLMDPAQAFLEFCTPDLSYRTAAAEEA